MQISRTKRYSQIKFLKGLLGGVLLSAIILSILSCAKTVKVYQPPRFDLSQFDRLGLITFSDNAQPSVAVYATEQFQNKIHSAQVGIPIVELGTEEEVLNSIGSNQLNMEALKKIREQYKVFGVFTGRVVYSEVNTNVNVKDITELKASVETTLNATLSVKLMETEGGATVWSDSASWKRKLGKMSVNENTGISLGTKGYDDPYRKLVPDMVHDITSDFRGRYVKERVNK